MTLHWRLAVALALICACAVTAASVVAYETTAPRLSSSVDSSLEQTAALLVRQLPPAANEGLPRPPGTVAPGSSQQAPSQSPPPPDLLNLVIEQRLNAAGDVTEDSSAITFPVTSADRLIAAKGGASLLETVVAGGDPYRAITTALPTGGAVQVGRDVRENDQLLASLRLRLGLIEAFVVAIAALAGWLIASQMTRPLKRLTRGAEEVARSGNLMLTLPTRGMDEIGRLGRSFTTMLHALGRSRAQQQQLIEDAAHELRTPLTSLQVNIDLLRRHGELPLEQRELILLDLDSELGELTALVGELVDLGTDQHAVEPRTLIRLDKLAEVVAARTRARSGREIVLDAEPWTVECQPEAFERVVGNLLDNATKFSPVDTPIAMRVRPRRLEVRDLGPGIPVEDIPRIFDRFHRSAGTRSLPGSGLGLSIVKDVVERHGGSVFACNAPGGGASVGFILP